MGKTQVISDEKREFYKEESYQKGEEKKKIHIPSFTILFNMSLW